jgi:hypothetical protein
MVSVLAIGPKARGFEPGRIYAFLRTIKIRSTPSFLDPRQGQRIFPLTSLSRPALRPTQPSVQWVPGVLSSEQNAAGA